TLVISHSPPVGEQSRAALAVGRVARVARVVACHYIGEQREGRPEGEHHACRVSGVERSDDGGRKHDAEDGCSESFHMVSVRASDFGTISALLRSKPQFAPIAN